MKALTIREPWASLIAKGAKRIETRGWATKYRGPLAIHAGGTTRREYFSVPILNALNVKSFEEHCLEFSLGKVIAIVDLIDCVRVIDTRLDGRPVFDGYPVDISREEVLFGDYAPGRYAWILKNVCPIKPVSVRGQQRLWNWEVKKA